MPDLSIETAATDEGLAPVAGVDEAGRGPLVGDVVAAACILPDPAPRGLLELLDDSKKLSAKARAAAEQVIREICIIGIGSASPEEIDRLNILQATFLAMRRALGSLPVRPRIALIDGNRCPGFVGIVERCIVKGDGISASIAAASIIAKEHRDRSMAALALRYPAYQFEKNAGYGTPAHLEALRRHGPTPLHRMTFAPVKSAAVELDRRQTERSSQGPSAGFP